LAIIGVPSAAAAAAPMNLRRAGFASLLFRKSIVVSPWSKETRVLLLAVPDCGASTPDGCSVAGEPKRKTTLQL